MSSRFLELGGDGGADLSILQTGSFSINVANIIDQSLTPNLPVVANAAKVLTSRLITLADLDFVPITNPNQGDLTIIGNLIAENVISAGLDINEFTQITDNKINTLETKTQNITEAVTDVTTMSGRLVINTASPIQPSLLMYGRLVQFGGSGFPTFDIIADRPGGMPDGQTINLINYRAATDANINALIARISMSSVGNITASNFASEYAIQTCTANTNIAVPRFRIGADNTTYITGNLDISAELTMNNNRIKLIANPIDDTDAASKIYVDGLTFGIVKNPMIDFLDCNGFDILGAGIMECKSIQLNGDFLHSGINQAPNYIAQYNKPIGVLNNDIIFQANYNTNLGPVAGILIRANSNHSVANRSTDYIIQTCLTNNITTVDRIRIAADNNTYISGGLVMNDNRVKSVAAPVNNGDAVNKLYVDNSLSNVVRNPMESVLFGGGFDILGVGIIESNILILNAPSTALEITGVFEHYGTGSAATYHMYNNRPNGVLDNNIIAALNYNANNNNNIPQSVAEVLLRSAGIQTISNCGCDYIIRTCLENSTTVSERFRIAADNNTYISGGLVMNDNRVKSVAAPVDNGDAVNKLYVDNNLSNVVRNPMQIDLDGGNNGMFGITFIECDSIVVLAGGFEVNSTFAHRKTTSPIFYWSVYDRPAILDGAGIYQANYGVTGGTISRVIISSSGDQSGSNRGCDYTIQTCLDNTTITVDRIRIAADNNTYISGDLVVGLNRLSSNGIAELPTIQSGTVAPIQLGSDLDFGNTFNLLRCPSINGIRPSGGVYSESSGVVLTGVQTNTSIIGLSTGFGSTLVPADTFQPGDTYGLKIGGSITCANGDIFTINIGTAGVSPEIFGSFVINIDGAQTNAWWDFKIEFVIRTIGGVGVAVVSLNGNFMYYNTNNFAKGMGVNSLSSGAFSTLVDNSLAVTYTTAETTISFQPSQISITKIF